MMHRFAIDQQDQHIKEYSKSFIREIHPEIYPEIN